MNSQSLRTFFLVLLTVSIAIPLLAQGKRRTSSSKSKTRSQATKPTEDKPTPQWEVTATPVYAIGEETKSFILDNCNVKMDSDFLMARLYKMTQTFEFDGCTASVYIKHYPNSRGYKFSLAELDQDEVRSTEGEITLRCSDSTDCFKDSFSEKYNRSEVKIYATNASRVTRAFVDAIKSCGGKKRRY